METNAKSQFQAPMPKPVLSLFIQKFISDLWYFSRNDVEGSAAHRPRSTKIKKLKSWKKKIIPLRSGFG